MPVLEPPTLPTVPHTPYEDLTHPERIEILRPALAQAADLVSYADQVAAVKRALAERLLAEPVPPTPVELRARELIAGTVSGTGRSVPPLDRVAAARALIAEARAFRRDARRYRWRIALRLAEAEEGV